MNRMDDFTRADSPTSLGTPSDGGSAWVAQSGTWGISSNTALYTQDAVLGAATLATLESDGAVSATIATAAAVYGIVARLSDPNNYLFFNQFGGSLQIGKNVGGSTSIITSAAGSFGSTDLITLELAGSTVTAKINGTVVLTATETFNQTETLHGLFGYISTTGSFATFSFTGSTPPPPASNRGLIDQSFTYWEYRPASGGDLSRLTLWMTPRNVLLYDAQADAALIWLQAHTPAALQF